MNHLFCSLFIKNADKTNDARVRETYGLFSGIVGIFVNILLSGFKLFAGLVSCSAALVADALNNVSDAGSSIISMISFKIAAKPADRDHPFGHARIEYIASMIVSFLILLMGFETLSDSFKTLFGLQEAKQTAITWFAIIVPAASILMKLWLASFYTYVGKSIQSSVVKAAAADSLSDCISTSAVLICAVIIRFFPALVWLDSVVGLAVSVLIIIAGIKILNETKNSLLGEAPVEDTVEKIKTIVHSYPEALGIHDMMVHNYGPHHLIASLHVEVDGSADVYHLHDAIDNMERSVHEELGILCTIHMDPIVINDEKVNELRTFVQKIVSDIQPDITIHDFRTVIGDTHTNLIFDIMLPFESAYTPAQIVDLINQKVAEARPHHFCVITVDRG